jgi:hypothetical protein
LARLNPAGGTFHASNTQGIGMRIDPANELVDDFWFVSSSLDLCRRLYEGGHFDFFRVICFPERT